MSNCPLCYNDVKLSKVSNCLSVKLSSFVLMVSNCPQCQIVLGSYPCSSQTSALVVPKSSPSSAKILRFPEYNNGRKIIGSGPNKNSKNINSMTISSVGSELVS